MRHSAGQAPGAPLFRLSQTQLGYQFRQACHHLQLPEIPTLYQLRHGGASWDFAAGRRTLAEVQRRGRWRAPASVRRYEKGGRAGEQLNRLPPRLRAHAVVCASHIFGIVDSVHLPLARP